MSAEPGPGEASAADRNPWHLRPFFGSQPVLPADARQTLRLVSLGLFFENYDMGLINAALPQIADDLSIATEDTGFYLGAIRMGGVGTFLLLPLADKLGRKRLFVAAFVGMSLGTLATAASLTPTQFAVAQCLTRTFLLVAAALALVIVVEEFPASHRGAGLGLLTLLGGLGYGTCAILYAMVDSLPLGWRGLYLIGVAPLLLLPFFRRQLRETRRFEAHRTAASDGPPPGMLEGWIGPMRGLLLTNRRRAIAVGLAAFLSSAGAIAFFQYTSLFVQRAHGWSPAGYTGLVMTGGIIGVMGSIFGGRGSDRYGRRLVGFTGLVFAPLFTYGFFFGPEYMLVLTWGMVVFCSSAGDVVVRALSAELFPTSQRGTASGWLMLVQTLGWTAGLLIVGFATDSMDDLGRTISALSLVMVLAAITLLTVPETHQQELESISDGDGVGT